MKRNQRKRTWAGGSVMQALEGLSAQLDRWLPWIVAAVAVLVFIQTPTFEFVHWDDHAYVFENSMLNPVSLGRILQLWVSGYQGVYVPMTFSVHGLHALLLGFDGGRFHVVSLLVHAANVVLVYMVLRQLLKARGAPTVPILAACGALLFAVHPIQVEAAAWVTGMKELLSTFFGLLALHFYFRDDEPDAEDALGRFVPPGTAWYVLALLSKPTQVMLGPVTLVLDIVVRRADWRTALRGVWPWFAIAVPFALIAKQLHPDTMLTTSSPLWLRPFVAMDAVQFYITKLLLPLGLTPDYGRTPDWLLESGMWRLSWVVPVLVFALALWAARRGRLAPVGLLSTFVVALFPVLGVVPFLTQNISTVADHYMYFPFLIVALAVSLLLAEIPAHRRMAAIAAVLLASVGLAAMSMVHMRVWRNDDALFPYAIARNPTSTLLYMNYFESLYKRGRYEESLQLLHEAEEVAPHASIFNNMGSALVRLERYDEAKEALGRALELDPDNKEYRRNLSVVEELRVRQGRD